MSKGRGIVFAGILGSLFFFLRGRVAKAKHATFDYADKISPNFRVSEFLKSETFPELASHRLTFHEYSNLKRLVTQVLQPLRDRFGPVIVSNGGRPEAVARAKGTTWYEALKARGYRPAKRSDHTHFAAADILIPGANLNLAYEALKKNPHTRQVILEYVLNPDGVPVTSHLHVAVVTPQLKKKTGSAYAFMDVPGTGRVTS